MKDNNYAIVHSFLKKRKKVDEEEKEKKPDEEGKRNRLFHRYESNQRFYIHD
jgi:hypothetical protein